MDDAANARTRRIVVHLTASPFLGGPERQMIGLARTLPDSIRSIFWSFAEGGKSLPFLEEAGRRGFETECLRQNAPAFRAVLAELGEKLAKVRPDLLLCHGYKADVLGGIAARRLGIPVVAVSRGWTGVSWKVRLNEMLDRISLVAMDRVVCVSEGQAAKVRRAGVPDRRIQVIRNAIHVDRFDRPVPDGRRRLTDLFPRTPSRVVGAAGRLSPEKGFFDLVEAAARLRRVDASTGFVIFGEGPLHDDLVRRAAAEGLSGSFVVSPFRADLDDLIPHLDVLAMSSYTEGLPNVALEASAASVPIVATDVGGIPEVVEHGVTGYLVPAGDPATLASRLAELLENPSLRASMGIEGRRRVERLFSFRSQASAYLDLFEEICSPRHHCPAAPERSSRREDEPAGAA